MKQTITTIGLLFFLCIRLMAQQIVKGVVKDNDTQKRLQNVFVIIKETEISIQTDVTGFFIIKKISKGKQLLTITKEGYEAQNIPITTDEKEIDLGTLFLLKETVLAPPKNLSIITISDDELSDGDTNNIDNIAGLLQASKDAYLRAAAFDFSSSFYRIRGLDSDNGRVLLNGIEMNKLFNGRPQWSNWGGLNNITKNQEFSNFLKPSNYTFGGVLGTTYINTRPSEQRPGIRVSYASSNRSYVHRVMGTYASGINKKGWSFSVSASRRAGEEGFVDGTSYNSFSIFGAIEKKINEHQALTLTGIYAPNRRGRSAPNTQEVFDLKGNKYNPYWGLQNGEIRNSRIREVDEPIFMLNHYWNINEKTRLQTNIGYQFGKTGSSRLDFGGTTINPISGFPEGSATNPDPTNFRKLPSYGLALGNTTLAFGLQQQFLNDGQLDWQSLYQENIDATNRGENAINILYEDRTDDTLISASSIFNTSINENIHFTGAFAYRNLKSENFASIIDLLGGTGFLDVDSFADDFINNPQKVQNDVLNPNRIVGENERFRYNYIISSDVISGFAQAQFNYKKVDFFTGISATQTSYQREGLFQNGGFINTSLGKGEKLNFTGLGVKGGLTYKLTGRHLFDFTGAYISQAPTIRNTFANSRENAAVIPDITEEKIISLDASYILRMPKIQAKLTGFYSKTKDANEVSFFFAQGITNGLDDVAFVQEILQGVDRKHFGGEFAVEVKVTPTIKLKGVAALGQYTFDNNPTLYVGSEDFVNLNSTSELVRDFGIRNFGETKLKNHRLASGPQSAFSVGFEYRDPNYWWIGVTANFLSHAYADVSPIQRSANFYIDPELSSDLDFSDGTIQNNIVAFNDFDPELARELLQQEQFDSYMITNLVGGKSWRFKKKYISVFASVNNVFNTVFKTGGFEQGRIANFRELRDDVALETRLFGNRFWYGRGATYFININYSF